MNGIKFLFHIGLSLFDFSQTILNFALHNILNFFILEEVSVFKMSADSRVPPRGATYHLFVDIIFQFIHFFIEIFFLFFNCVFNL